MLAIPVSAVLAAESVNVAPGITSSYEVVESPVLKVFAVKDGKHSFVAYLVKWKNSEVIVSDALAESNFKVGDKISFLAQKTTVEKKGGSTVDSLSFTLTRHATK